MSSGDGYVSNRKAANADLSAKIKKHIIAIGVDATRMLQDEFQKPKHGRLYGVDRPVKFKTKDGRDVSFVANAGKLAAYRKYRTGKRKTKPSGIRRRSGPGEAPAIQTAALIKSSGYPLGYRLTQISDIAWSLILGVTIQGGRGSPQGKTGKSIAEDLEFGTSRMKPRPAWRPMLAKLIAKYSTK